MTPTDRTAHALRLAARPGGVTAADLVAATGLEVTAARRHLRRLEAAGLLLAEEHPERAGQPLGSWATRWRAAPAVAVLSTIA